MSVEVAVRDYLRSCESVMSLLNNDEARLNMDFRGNLNATHVTLYQGGGGLHPYLPLQLPTIVLHCFGSTRAAAADLAAAVADAVRNVHEGHKPLASGEVLSVLYLPTPDGVSRYVVTTSVTVKVGLAA